MNTDEAWRVDPFSVFLRCGKVWPDATGKAYGIILSRLNLFNSRNSALSATEMCLSVVASRTNLKTAIGWTAGDAFSSQLPGFDS